MKEVNVISPNKFEVFPAASRIWIYQSNIEFSEKDTEKIRQHINAFTQQWTSHSRALQAAGDVLHQRFIVLMVNENQADASGCSIDKSVHFIKALEQEYQVDLFDRMTFTYEKSGEVRAADRAQFAALYAAGEIDDNTIVFDNLVKTKNEFDNKWRVRLGDSWHKNIV